MSIWSNMKEAYSKYMRSNFKGSLKINGVEIPLKDISKSHVIEVADGKILIDDVEISDPVKEEIIKTNHSNPNMEGSNNNIYFNSLNIEVSQMETLKTDADVNIESPITTDVDTTNFMTGNLEISGDCYINGNFSGSITTEGDCTVDGSIAGGASIDGDCIINGTYYNDKSSVFRGDLICDSIINTSKNSVDITVLNDCTIRNPILALGGNKLSISGDLRIGPQ